MQKPATPSSVRRALVTALPLALLGAGCAQPPSAPPAPVIVPVAEWGGTAGPVQGAPQDRITQITLHHQGETWVEGRDVAAYLRRLQIWSRETKRWADIPYHYVIAPNGQVFAARPENQAGDTNTEYDPRGHVLIMVLGNFEEVQPNEAQLRSVVAMMAWQARRHGLDERAIASHKDHSKQTVCPGKNLYRYLESGWIQRSVGARLAGQPELPLPLPRQ